MTKKAQTCHSVMDSPVGKLHLITTAEGLSNLSYTRPPGFTKSDTDSPLMKRVKSQLKEYFEGKRKEWDFPLDWGSNDGFYSTVRKACAKVEYGKTVSYQGLARRAKSLRAARAVGTAMATNPLSIVVPCHRVIRADGKSGNYGGGKDQKQWLLELERSNS